MSDEFTQRNELLRRNNRMPGARAIIPAEEWERLRVAELDRQKAAALAARAAEAAAEPKPAEPEPELDLVAPEPDDAPEVAPRESAELPEDQP